MRFRRNINVAISALVLVVAACTTTPTHDAAEQVDVAAPPTTSTSTTMTTTTTTISPLHAVRAAEESIGRYVLASAARHAAAAVRPARVNAWPKGQQTPRWSRPVAVAPIAAAGASLGMGAVMACIKRAESGNYSESSHPGSGSGAYQYVPGTWRTWSARAGHGGYAYAYQAPASVQDAVTAYTLTHGGAGNWSPRFGADSCTVGMGG